MSILNNWVYRTVSKTYRNGMNVTHIYLYVSYILLHVAIHYNSYVYFLLISSFGFCINYITYYRLILLASSPRNLQKTFTIVYYQNHIPSYLKCWVDYFFYFSLRSFWYLFRCIITKFQNCK